MIVSQIDILRLAGGKPAILVGSCHILPILLYNMVQSFITDIDLWKTIELIISTSGIVRNRHTFGGYRETFRPISWNPKPIEEKLATKN